MSLNVKDVGDLAVEHYVEEIAKSHWRTVSTLDLFVQGWPIAETQGTVTPATSCQKASTVCPTTSG